MIVFLNGKFVPEDQAVVSVFDRSFLYGDGLFETMRICKGEPFRWEQHLERFAHGAEFLKIRLPFSSDSLRGFVAELVSRNQMPEALLRATLSRGIGLRGYSPKGADRPSLVMSLHPAPALDAPARWSLVTSSCRLPANEPLAQFKTCNKLPQILARAEADAAGADEALLLNTEGYVVEVINEAVIAPAALRQVQGIFLSLSSVGIAECVTLDGISLTRSPLVDRLRIAYNELLSDSGIHPRSA